MELDLAHPLYLIPGRKPVEDQIQTHPQVPQPL